MSQKATDGVIIISALLGIILFVVFGLDLFF